MSEIQACFIPGGLQAVRVAAESAVGDGSLQADVHVNKQVSLQRMPGCD